MIMEILYGCRKGDVVFGLTALVFSGLMVIFSPQPASATVPEAFSRGFSDIVAKVQPAVVNVAVAESARGRGPRRLPPGPFGGPPGPPGPPMLPPGPPGRPPGPPGMSAGSGVIISPEGYIVTNNHVVEESTDITVTTFDGKEHPAKVVGTDPKTDLAVIRIDGDKLPFISWSLQESIKVGDLVLAVGSPFGLASSVTMGIISAMGRGNVGITEYEDFIQTDAPINPGNSGGPLVNMAGEIVGINTAIFSRTGGSQGIGFAIPVDIVQDITSSLIKTGRVVRGWMGIAIQELSPALAQSFQLPESHQGGVLISEVNEKGPSAGGLLQRGDVLLEYRGKKVRDVNHLRNIVARTPVGSEVELSILRNGEQKKVTMTVGERPTDEMLASGRGLAPPATTEKLDNVLAGLDVAPLTDERRKQLNVSEDVAGVVVNEVEPGSAAESAGLQQGDIIHEVNREVVNSLDDYQRVAPMIKKEELVVLFLSRRGNNLFVAVNPE